MSGAVFIAAWVAFVVGVFVGIELVRGAPVCTCGDVDCGGWCIEERGS